MFRFAGGRGRWIAKFHSHANFSPLFLPSPAQLGLAYLLSEVLLAVTRHANAKADSRHDRNSLRVLWIAIGLSIAAGIYLTHHVPAAALPHHRSFAIAGAVIFVVGLILRWWSIVQLGRFFTVNVSIAEDHRLVNSGPYRFVRHPSYTGALLAFLGFSLSLGNGAAVLAIMLPISAAFAYRIDVEERALIAGLGEAYRDYAARTKRLLPFVY